MNLIVKYHELLPYLIISNFQTLTSFFRCTVSEYAEYTNAKYKMSFVHWRLTLFIKSLTPHCQDANQAHSNMEWENVLFFFWGNLLSSKFPFGCQVFVGLRAEAVITVWDSECRILPPHLSTNYSQQMLVWGGSFSGVSETDILVSGACALLTHAVLALLYRGVALSLGRRLLILSKSWGARLSSLDSTRWSLELYL